MTPTTTKSNINDILKRCAKRGGILCDKRGCPVHDMKNAKPAATASDDRAKLSALLFSPKRPKSPVSRKGPLTKAARVGKTPAPMKVAKPAVRLAVEARASTILKTASENDKPAAAVVKKATATTTTKSVARKSSCPFDDDDEEDDASSRALVKATNQPGSSRSSSSISSGQRSFVAVPKNGTKKPRRARKPSGLSKKQQAEKFFKR